MWEQISNFLLHLTPSFILMIFLIIAWKRELIGGIIFTLIGLVLSPLIFTHNYNMNQSIWVSLGVILSITIPFVIVGILFIVSYRIKKRELLSSNNNQK